MADADRRVDPITGLPTEFDDEFDNQSVDSDELVSEPGHVGDLTDFNVQEVPSERAPDSQPATLIRCKVERMHIIAKQLGIANYKRLNKAPLYNAIYTAMTEKTNCETCNGPCDPSSHVFPGIVDKSPVRTRGKSKSSLPPLLMVLHLLLVRPVPSQASTLAAACMMYFWVTLSPILFPILNLLLLLMSSSVTQFVKALPPPVLPLLPILLSSPRMIWPQLARLSNRGPLRLPPL